MRPIQIIVVIVLAVLAGAYLLYRRSTKSGSESLGFRDILKDGHKRQQLIEQMNPQDLDKLTDSEVHELVEAYVKTQHQSPEYWAVRELKDRAVPFLIEVLKRPESFIKPDPKGILDEAPAQRALAMLWSYPQDSIIPLLLPFVESNEKWQRQEAARHLAASGKTRVKEAVTKLLGDPEDYVRSSAVGGLLAASKAQRAEPALLEAVFESLKPLTKKKDKAMVAKDAAELLLQIDRRRAAKFLTDAAVISSSNPNLDRVLATLTVQRVPAPPDLLIPIVEKFTSGSDYLESAAYGEALKNLALQKHPAVEGLVRKTLAEPAAPDEAQLPAYLRPRFDRRKCAAQALCILNDVPDPIQTAFSNEEKVGFERLPLPQQRLVLVVHLDGQVGNGGFSQYFFNSSDDTAQVIGALDDICGSECARIFRNAVSVFGKAGPSRDNETRHRQLEKLSARQDEVLEKANEQWFAEHKDIEAQLYLYALKHRTNFVRLSE